MFCPGCGSEERQLRQFCRACGMDLRALHAGLERPDAVTDATATSSREEIERAIAAKIRELRKPGDLARMARYVLPQIEKFLESPEEKRLRRMRAGVITSSVGFSVALMFLIFALIADEGKLLLPMGAAIVAFFIGIGLIINGKLLTIQTREITDCSPEAAAQSLLDRLPVKTTAKQRELPPMSNPPLSVIEHTTHRLSNEPATIHRRPAAYVKDEN
jgi:hypothetical protein